VWNRDRCANKIECLPYVHLNEDVVEDN
jgi:hypothetical protein